MPNEHLATGRKSAASLRLTVLRCPDTVIPETRSIASGQFTVGRGPGVDWVLADPERVLSRHHFAVTFSGGNWLLADTSTNGTFLNRETSPVGAGNTRNLHNADRLRLGAYEIEVRLEEVARAPAAASRRFADPFAVDPLGPPRPAKLPDDFDPLTPEPQELPLQGSTRPDHSPAAQDADLLPVDWDKELLDGISPAGKPVSPSPESATRPNGPRRNPGRPTSPAGGDDMSSALDAYLERLLKLIPAEVVSIYPVGRSLIDDDWQQGLWALVCLSICVLFRARLTRGPDGRPQWLAIGIAAISFMIWVYVLGSHVPGLALPTGYKVWPALMLLIWTSVIPALYTGQQIPVRS